MFNCDGISSLTFEAGAMRNLGHLSMEININDWDRAAPQGLQHLEGLQEIRSVFQDTVDMLPSRPVFTYDQHPEFFR